MYIKFNMEDKAEEYLDSAEKMYRELDGEKSLKMANIIKNRGRIHGLRREFEKAYELYEKSIEMKK